MQAKLYGVIFIACWVIYFDNFGLEEGLIA